MKISLQKTWLEVTLPAEGGVGGGETEVETRQTKRSFEVLNLLSAASFSLAVRPTSMQTNLNPCLCRKTWSNVIISEIWQKTRALWLLALKPLSMWSSWASLEEPSRMAHALEEVGSTRRGGVRLALAAGRGAFGHRNRDNASNPGTTYWSYLSTKKSTNQP